MSHKPNAEFIDEHHLRVGDLDFHCDFTWDVEDDLPHPKGFFSIRKTRPQIERYLDLFSHFSPENIVELGIRWGGSTIFLHAINQPEKLIAFDIEQNPATELTSYIRTRNLNSVIRPYYGVDQADREKITSVITKELGSSDIDLVIDDASHLLQETITSFETLFPLLRPGGLYIVEDWNADHIMADGINAIISDRNHPKHIETKKLVEQEASADRPFEPRLIRFPLELVLAIASAQDIIREITVMDNWVIIKRGNEAVDSASFQLNSLAKDHFFNLRN